MFVFNAVPIPLNKSCERVAGAKVHIWVIATDMESAKIRALDYIANYFWEVTSLEYELEIPQEQISQLHEDKIWLYQKALQYGIAADFLEYLKE